MDLNDIRIETAPTNASRCERCNTPIIKGNIRMKRFHTFQNHRTYSLKCETCAKEALKNEKETITELQKLLEEPATVRRNEEDYMRRTGRRIHRLW